MDKLFNQDINGTWKDIGSVVDVLNRVGLSINDNLKVSVGDGKKTKFWRDSWITETPLKDRFPDLFSIASLKEGLVADHLSSEAVIGWRLPWTANNLSQTNSLEISQLLQILRGFSSELGPDRWYWSNPLGVDFSAKHIRYQWHVKACSDPDTFQFKWNSWSPPKCNYLLWRVLLGKVASKPDLIKRGVQHLNPVCDRCQCGDEDIDHIFFNCLWARSIWWQILAWIRIPFPLQAHKISEIISMVSSNPGSRRWKKTVYVVAMATIWRLWHARNAKVFEDSFIPPTKTVELIKEDAFIWISNRSKIQVPSWENWLNFDILDML